MAANSFVNGSFDDPKQWLMNTLMILPAILIGLTVHEFAHAFVAYRLGDITPKVQKRVSLNPIRHVDPIGMIALLFIGFGWGKPVEVNPYNFKNQRRDNFLTDIAGIVTNIIVAIIFAGIVYAMVTNNPNYFYYTTVGSNILNITANVIWINLVLAVFNLLPVPPLDGFGIVTEVFNLRKYPWYPRFYELGFPILMVLIIFNITERILVPIMNFLYDFILGIFF